MKQTLLFIFTFIVVGLQAQLSYGPENLSYEGPNDESGLVQYEVMNDTDEGVNFYWTLDRGNSPEEWKFSICDRNSCYAYGVETCPSSKPNEFMRNELFSGFQLHIKPEGVNGVADVTMKFYSIDNPNEVYLEIPFALTIGSTSTEEINVESIALYPNPSTDFFQIRNDDNVKHISLHSILGKKVFDMNHESEKAYNISDLGRGMYMVRMYDRDGDVIKVLRLSKR